MTRQDYIEMLAKLHQHVKKVEETTIDLIPQSKNEQEWSGDYEVSLNIAEFVLLSAVNELQDIMERFYD